MKPALGKGTVRITFFSNQLSGRVVASTFGSVGLRVVSIGLPISVIEDGRCSSPSSAISEAAASTGTPG